MAEGELLEDRWGNFEDLRPSFREPVNQWSAERIAAEILAHKDLDQPQAAFQSAEDLSMAIDEDSPLQLPMTTIAQPRGCPNTRVLQTGDEHPGSYAILILSERAETRRVGQGRFGGRSLTVRPGGAAPHARA